VGVKPTSKHKTNAYKTSNLSGYAPARLPYEKKIKSTEKRSPPSQFAATILPPGGEGAASDTTPPTTAAAAAAAAAAVAVVVADADADADAADAAAGAAAAGDAPPSSAPPAPHDGRDRRGTKSFLTGRPHVRGARAPGRMRLSPLIDAIPPVDVSLFTLCTRSMRTKNDAHQSYAVDDSQRREIALALHFRALHPRLPSVSPDSFHCGARPPSPLPTRPPRTPSDLIEHQHVRPHREHELAPFSMGTLFSREQPGETVIQ